MPLEIEEKKVKCGKTISEIMVGTLLDTSFEG